MRAPPAAAGETSFTETRRTENHVTLLLSSLALRPTLTFIIRAKRDGLCVLQHSGTSY